MMTRQQCKQLKLHVVTIEDLVPEDHFLRKVEQMLDLSFIYDEVEDMYCSCNGRPSIDPVMLIKFLLLGFLYGIPSERRIEEEIRVNVAYRWYLGLDLLESVPDHSTISQNRRRRFNQSNLFRALFERIVTMCIENGLVDGKLVFTDSTHIKANASRKSEYIRQVEAVTNHYLEELDQYEEAVRKQLEEEGKIKPVTCRKRKERTKIVERRESKTDPEAGYYCRKGKPLGMHYLSHETVDSKAGIIIDVAATPGNVRDSQPYMERIDYIENNLGLKIQAACADGAYDTSLIHQQFSERGIEFYTPKTMEPKRGTTEFQRDSFRFDTQRDVFICPAEKELQFRRLNRTTGTISKEYSCKKEDCQNCALRSRCVSKRCPAKRIQVNIFEEIVRKHHENDGSEKHRRALTLRQIWSEGTFAAQKARHNLKFMYRRGQKAAEQQCLLSSSALNIRRMVKMMG